jgi:hypothetical protein
MKFMAAQGLLPLKLINASVPICSPCELVEQRKKHGEPNRPRDIKAESYGLQQDLGNA